MNHANIRLTDLARFGKIKYTSLKDRFDKMKLYASEIEMIAKYFNRPVSYYFDQDELGQHNYTMSEDLNIAQEPKGIKYSGNESKQRQIEVLTKKLNAAYAKIEKQDRRYIRLLEKRMDNNDD